VSADANDDSPELDDADALDFDLFDFNGGTSEVIRLLHFGHHPGNEGI
jgi:hypothetical protein